jgi:hypothetical protein
LAFTEYLENLTNKNLQRRLVVAAAISAFGDGLSNEAAPFLIDVASNSPLQLALGNFGVSLAKIVVGLLIGRHLTPGNAYKFASMASLLAILPTLAWCVPHTNVPVMLGLQIIRGGFGAVMSISMMTVLMKPGNGGETLKNFATLQFTVGSVEGVGGFLAPLLTHRFGAGVFVADAISFAVFFALLVGIQPPVAEGHDDLEIAHRAQAHPVLEFTDALRYVVNDPRLFSVVIAFSACYVSWAVNSAVAYPILREWGLPREYRSFYKLAVISGGLVTAWQLMCPPSTRSPRLPSSLALGGSIGLLGAVTVMTGCVGPGAGITGILLQFPQGIVSDAASAMSRAHIAQRCVTARGASMTGPVNGLVFSLNQTVLGVGKLLGGAIAEAYSARIALICAGLSTMSLLWVAAQVDATPPSPPRRPRSDV